MTRRNILVITGDRIAEKMAGPAIRAFEIASVLALSHNVQLVSTLSANLTSEDFPILASRGKNLSRIVTWADVIIFQGFVLAQYPWIAQKGKVLIADLYDPMHLEQLEDSSSLPLKQQKKAISNTIAVISDQLRKSDHVICASEKQRDFWLGHLSAIGRVNPVSYQEDPGLRRLIDVVPFGISKDNPVSTRNAIKDVVPGISSKDKVIIWAGGIYNWFDPLTLIRAVGLLSQRRANIRLFFLGVTHPNPNFPKFAMSTKAQELSDELGLTNTFVFFNHEWVDYADRANYLLESDLGVSTHFDHLETAFSFRTRILDYLWAKLPIVSTEGDSFADDISQYSLGLVVPPEDPLALSNALEELLFDEDLRTISISNISDFRSNFFWSESMRPLIQMCASAQKAPDISNGTLAMPLHFPRDSWLRGKLRGARMELNENGLRGVFSKFLRGEEK